MINQKDLFRSLLLCGFLSVFFSLPLPKGVGETTIFINRMIFTLAFIAPVGYYFCLNSERKGEGIKVNPYSSGEEGGIYFVTICLSLVIFGYKLFSCVDFKGAWALHNESIFIFLCVLVTFTFLPFLRGFAWILIVLLGKKITEAVSEEKCPTESFYSSEYNSAGKMPN